MADDTEHLDRRTDDELAELARHRREHPAGAHALEVLLDRYRRQRFSLAHRYRGRTTVEDLAQEAAIALVRAIDTHRPEKGPIGPWIWQWMWGATLRVAKESWSRAPTAPLDSAGIELLDDDSPTPADVVVEVLAHDQEHEALADALRHLPNRERHALLELPGDHPSRRRTALAMLRHPAVRPAVDRTRTPSRCGADSTPPSIADGGDVSAPSLCHDGTSWLHRASCRGTPPTLFWGREVTTRKRALELCARCAVRRECLLDALTLPAGGGIRAGTTEKQRRTLKRLLMGDKGAPPESIRSAIACFPKKSVGSDGSASATASERLDDHPRMCVTLPTAVATPRGARPPCVPQSSIREL